MSEAEVSQFLCVLIKMGEALQNSGAEVFRVEDTLNRIAAAYGAEEVNIFVITSSIVVTLTMPDLPPQTQTRRLRKSTGNDLLELEQLNALSRRICAEKPPVEEFQQQLSTILAQPGEPRLHLAGSVLAAASFAVFFGGSLWDGVLAGGVAVFICWMERWLAPFCLNGVAFQFIASFLSGMAARCSMRTWCSSASSCCWCPAFRLPTPSGISCWVISSPARSGWWRPFCWRPCWRLA